MRRFNTEPGNALEKMRRYLGSMRGFFMGQTFSDIRSFLMFIGYPRSGHTLIGSLLDAHPDMVIAHELDALYYFGESFKASQVYYLILQNSRAFTREGRQWMGYKYDVPEQWQSFIELNAEKAAELPVLTEKKEPLKKMD